MAPSNNSKPDAKTQGAAMAAPFMALNPAAAQAWQDVMSDSARFLAERFQQDMDTQKALLSCKNPAELLQVQTDFFQSAMQQYSDHATRVFSRLSAAADSSGAEGKGGRSGTARKYDDVPI